MSFSDSPFNWVGLHDNGLISYAMAFVLLRHFAKTVDRVVEVVRAKTAHSSSALPCLRCRARSSRLNPTTCSTHFTGISGESESASLRDLKPTCGGMPTLHSLAIVPRWV